MEKNLNITVEEMTGVGPKMASKLKRLGIETGHDLLFNFPRRYDDYTQITAIGEIAEILNNASTFSYKPTFTVRGDILGIANKKTRRRGFTVTEAVVVDSTGSIKVVWFNQPYLAKMLQVGSKVILNGLVAYDSFSNSLVLESPNRTNYPKIVPIYAETNGISSFFISKLVEKIINLTSEVEDYLPEDVIKKYDLFSLREAIFNIHKPKDSSALAAAKRRLAFDEIFLISLQANLMNLEIKKEKAVSINVDILKLREKIGQLPYILTNDQKKALWAIIKDIEKEVPMSRLLNGDVGSGKTVVAVLASYLVSQSGLKTLIMAPTEILANQHYETFQSILGQDLKIGILTASKKDYEDKDTIIGTHALIQKDVLIDNIGLVVVDEQHRFGVNQRQALQKIGEKNGLRPHFLSMTATPIPRTLHLAIFGDLDISLIKEKPKDRKDIITKFVPSFDRERSYKFIENEIKSGRQAFIICPLIEEKNQTVKKDLFEEERKTVLAEALRLKNEIFPNFEIGLLHGKMKAKEKEAVMNDFTAGKINILVSTSVVEVGVDIPNATVMIIEDAERFGLAQIHQFRGRVGRGEHQSHCFLFSNSVSDKAINRLKSLESVSDGFKLAEIDLETRGPGSIFGLEQSGLLDLKMASLSDRILIEEASSAAKEIAPILYSFPKLITRMSNFKSNKHLE
jgi:ATP-dependent DNA helicase RecG